MKMACRPVGRPTFFEIFKAHCSESDLGPISLNWFEELTAEAPPYEPKLLGELDAPSGWLDPAPFKTPRTKPSTYTQLASTPLIFKEQNATLPPCSSPEKDLDQKKGTNRENPISPSNTRRKTDQESEILVSPPGTCHNCLAASPAILRNTYRTPQRNNMPGPYGSLFCTPKLLEARTPKCISESLGAEVDPDMSWSSSLATPPTLGETVIIARENDSISEAKRQDGRAAAILHNFASNQDKCPGISDTSMLSVPEKVNLNAEDDIKDLESEVLDGLLDEMNSFEDTFNMSAKSSGTLLLVPHALDAVEKCEINTDKAQGKEDILSEQPDRRKTGISQEVKTNNWTEKGHCTEMNGSLLQNTGEGTGDDKDGHEKELESLRITGDVQDFRAHESFENEKPVKEAEPSLSSQWSQLNLSDLDVTHLEMSMCSSPPSDLHREENLGEKSVLMTKDDAGKTSLPNTSGSRKTQKLLSVSLSEKCYEMKNGENNPTSDITPIQSVSLSVQDPKLVKGGAAEVSKMSFLNCNSFLIERTNVTEYSVVYNASFSKHLKTTSKSVVTDVLSHPLVCSAASPDNCGDLHLINSENTLTKSGFKSLNMLSSLRKRSKRFIYTINNTLLYQEEKIQKEVTSESPIHPVFSHLESDSYEYRGCQVASEVDQDHFLLAKRKHLRSNTRTKNFSTCTLKMDTIDSLSSNSFNSRLKQQGPRDMGESARQDQPATSIKCLEVSNTQKEDTNSLNSEIISNIKRKVVTSSQLMARKRSGFLPKSCCTGKGEEGKDVSANTNSGDAAPQSLKEELGSSPQDKEHLADVHHDPASVTDSSSSDALSRISFGITGASSDCCSKLPDKRRAADQRSGFDCREVCRPLRINCSENDSTGLKQGEQTDAAAFSEVVANNEDPKLTENNESPQAVAFSNVAAEIAKELLDCMDNSSLNEVISEEDEQVAPMYCSKKPKENLMHNRASSGNLNACSLNPDLGGFQTASNKQIQFSEASIAKGRMLFKDIENECFETSFMERARNFPSQIKKQSMFFSDSGSKLGSNPSDSLDSQTSFLEPKHTQFIPRKVGLCKSIPRTQALQEANQTLTASQEAEIAELSSILEETGSQFEFTQFRKQSSIMQSHAFQEFGTVERCGIKNVENISEAREDASFCSTFKSENHVKNGKWCTQQEDTNEDSEVAKYGKENAVVFHKNDKKVSFTNFDINESRSDESFPIDRQDSFSNFIGFTSAGGKKISISKTALRRSAELFRDLDDDNYLFKSSENSTRCHNSNVRMSANSNFFRCLGKESKGKAVCSSDFKSLNAISPTVSVSCHAQNKIEENGSTAFRENTENKTKLSINGTENISVSNINTNNVLSSVKNQNYKQNYKTSKQVFNGGDGQAEGNLQDSSLDVTCLEDAIMTAEEHYLSISDEMENQSRISQKGEDRKEKECLSPKFGTPAGGELSISRADMNHSLDLFSVECGERDVKVLENSDKEKTDCKNIEEDFTHSKNLLVKENRIKMGSCHQIPFEQEVDVEKNDVKGSYLTGFHTASGKKIAIADGFLAKAEQFFSEEIDVGKEHKNNFENIRKRKCSKNCVKDYDLCIESIAQWNTKKLTEKLFLEEPGDQFKQPLESSAIEDAVILDPVKADTFVNVSEDCERSLVTLHAHKADVRPGRSELKSLPGQKSDALSRTCLSEDGRLAETKMEYSPRKRDDSENMDDFPVHSASLHLMKAPNDTEDNRMPGVTENILFFECDNKSDQSLLLNSKSSCSYLNGESKELGLKHLNEPCADTNCFTGSIVNACQNQSLISLPEDENNLTRLKETTLNVEKQKGDLKQTVFSTAKGKAVSVSESALARVRQMFQGEYSGTVKYEIKPNSRINQTEIARSSSSDIHAECPDSANSNATASEEVNSATSQFIKVNASASENGHRETNTSADAKPVSNSQKQCFEENIKFIGHLSVPDKQIKPSDASTSNFGFFSRASGKPVQLSEESLRKATQLFSEMEGNHSSHVQEAFLGEEDTEKPKMHTEVLPRKTQIVSPKGEEDASTKWVSDSAFGFSTASGKQVTVSKDAYQKAKAILKESDDYLSSGLCITDQLSSIKENVQHAKCLTDKVTSESKIENSCNQDSGFQSICSEEMKSFSRTHHVKMPEYVPYSKKKKQLASFKNSFQQEETRSFGKGQLNLGSKTESEAMSCSATAKAGTTNNLLQTPKNHLEVEAVESVRAFMEDCFSNSGVQINAAQSFSGRLDKNFQNKTFGKRHFEENNSLGEPPIKRQLLLEFNRTENAPRSLKASKTTPDGIFKDRRKFLYHVPLKPVTCQPFGSTKERQEVKNPTLTLPDEDLKGFQSKPAIFQHCALRQPSNGTSGVPTPYKASAKESEEARSLYKSGKTAKTFIPPFKTKLTISTSKQGSSNKCDSPNSKDLTEEMELNQITAEQNTAEPEDHQSCIQHAANTDLENGNLAVVRMVTNLHCARDLQEMRIKKKCRQNIRSQPGSLYVTKTSASNRISLKTAVEEKSPSFYSMEELYTHGVSKQCIQVNSTNAESFQFLVEDFFSKEYLLAGNGMQLADGGWLIPTDEGKAGKKEFYRALCDTPGVDPKLITEAWVYNHYRWIVWKLAAMEVSFPHEFANRCLTPEMVLLQLKYRYDLEIDKSKRSAIKKITERDDAAGKTLVLCISKIISLNTIVSPSSSNKNVENKREAAIIEVTDGWYGIRALLDPPLKAFLDRRRLAVGQKIIVHGAELVGSQNGCAPLEAPDSLMLKISANSTRCARWHAKLGFHRDPRPFPLPLSSLYSEGGAVGCVDVVIQRTYPIQWMEKTSAGSYVFRNSRAEEREAAKHAEDQQKKLEALFAKIQAEYEKHEERATRRTPRSRIITRQQIHNLQDGAELYEAIQNASDPGYMEGYLSEEQLKSLSAYRQLMNDKKQTQMQEEFKKALESAEQESNGCSKRDVSAVWKLCVVDYREQEKHKGVILSIWRPLPDVFSLLKEGSRYRIYQLSASQSKGRSDSTHVQLTATKKTQYLQLSVSQERLEKIFFPRKALKFTSLLDPSFQPPCAEVDLVGVIVSVSRTGFITMVYFSDENYNLVAVKTRTDLRHFAIEDTVVRCALISASNLQWQSEFRSEIPVLMAGDLSVFSASPKENYLQEKLNELRSMIENVASFCSDAESKLMNLLQRNTLLTPSLTKRCGLESPSPSCSFADDKSLISSRIEIKHPSPLSTSTPNMKFVTPRSAKTPSSATVNEDHLKNSKKRKAMDFLSCIPAPPPLTPICSVISPSVKKAFQPPRSLGLQHSKTSKETDQNIGRVTSCRKLRETVHLPENDLVADEELAMINTQALMNNLPEEKKMDYVNEDSNTIVTNLSDGLSSRNSSRSTGEASISSKSCSEVAEALQNIQNESVGSLPAQGVLQRQTSQKRY